MFRAVHWPLKRWKWIDNFSVELGKLVQMVKNDIENQPLDEKTPAKSKNQWSFFIHLFM